ncbi:hypothetical protein H6A35_08515 [Collinsella tanakaei]|nr:hypothetical protein [Collinsella tanakaei]
MDMLLIRSLGQEQYARQINQDVVGCRDLLSHLFCKTDNKYPYADFYEALFSQVRRRFHPPVLAIHGLSDWQMQLVTFLLDPLVADTYMTFSILRMQRKPRDGWTRLTTAISFL